MRGKTSLAEAIEFLLTGDIARRELLASTRDEFAGALRNAHLAPGVETFVEAHITDEAGNVHRLRRTLSQDFGKRQDCSSHLELNGAAVTPGALAGIGIHLSEPPLSAPILMHHNLVYLFSAKPQERSLYFKILLEVTDLEDLRAELKTAADTLPCAESETLSRFDRCHAVDTLTPFLAPIGAGTPTLSAIESAVFDAIGKLLRDAAEAPPPTLAARLDRLGQLLEIRRAKTFPLHGFARSAEIAEWEVPPDSTWSDLGNYATKLSGVEKETSHLISIFEMILALPEIKTAVGALDCPVCETPAGLTPERIQTLRETVASNAELRQAEQTARAALRSLDAATQTLWAVAKAAVPRFLRWDAAERRDEGFRTNRLAELVDESVRGLLPAWFNATRRLMRSKRRLEKDVNRARAMVSALEAEPARMREDTELRAAFDAIWGSFTGLGVALRSYKDALSGIKEPLQEAVDLKSYTSGRADLIDLGRSPADLRAELIERRAREALAKDLELAIRQVDQAKEAVLDEKFEDLAGAVRKWWDLLRPEETSFFRDLGLRPGATRTIDFKVGLASSADRSNVKIRDAVAVFSHSQLHCLGLATFFARTAQPGGFVLLDDPITSIDDDYSAHFINSAVAALLDKGVQVIILTYDQKTFRALEERYQGRAEVFQLNLDDPIQGTWIAKSSDTLAMLLKAAEPFTRSSVLATRKQGCQRIRDCGERFCKELLVRKRREQGETTALITDYSGPRGNLDSLIDQIIPFLIGSDEPGKLRMLRQIVNPGSHDDDVPSRAFLATLRGDLEMLRKKYLS